jgi:hypothetical protein
MSPHPAVIHNVVILAYLGLVVALDVLDCGLCHPVGFLPGLSGSAGAAVCCWSGRH